jgi:hypothetical protein
MSSPPIRFVEVCQRVPICIGLPLYLLEVLDQFLAPGINHEAILTGMVAQQGIHAVDPIRAKARLFFAIVPPERKKEGTFIRQSADLPARPRASASEIRALSSTLLHHSCGFALDPIYRGLPIGCHADPISNTPVRNP